MSVLDDHNRFVTVQTFDGRRIQIDTSSGDITELSFSGQDAPVSDVSGENVSLPIPDSLAPPTMSKDVTDLSEVIRGKRYKSSY